MTTLAVLGLAARPTAAQTYFPSNATINYAVNGNAIVGYDNSSDYNNNTNGTSPTIYLVTGGSIPNKLLAYNYSTVNVTGGYIANTLLANDHSAINVSGGTIGSITASDNSTTDITGGDITAGFQSLSGSNNTISGGVFGPNSSGFNFVDQQSVGNFTFVGYGLTATDLGPGVNNEDYLLSGTLSDGTSVNGDEIVVGNSAVPITLDNISPPAPTVPEPPSVAAFGLTGLFTAGLMLRARKRRLT